MNKNKSFRQRAIERTAKEFHTTNMFHGIDQKDDSLYHDSNKENDDSDIEPGK